MRGALAGAVVLAALTVTPVAAGGTPAAVAPPVIAVIGEAGLNPAHVEFRHEEGPVPPLPPHQVITLPDAAGAGSFAELADAMAAGPLGRLEPGALYRIDGTRVLVQVPAGLDGPYDLIGGVEGTAEDHRRHGTGVLGAAIGTTHGTAPDAWAVFIPTGDPSGFAWLAEQDWVDAASISSYTVESFRGTAVLPCSAAPHVRAFVRDRTFFASSGNSDSTSLYALNSLPEFYLVGGVEQDGSAVLRPRVPASADEDELSFSLLRHATRTFESGDRYEFPAADFASVHGVQRFGGTSGASPSTAGRAATVVHAARVLLADDGSRPSDVLAALGDGATAPATGPLSDGALTAQELAALLHAVAEPQLVGPGRYAVEGYGALSDRTLARAQAVLRGDVPLPSRSDDDAAHQRSEDLRASVAAARACG